jgi:hypothetical protein
MPSHRFCDSVAAARNISNEDLGTNIRGNPSDREAIMTPATRHSEEARWTGPEAERSEDPIGRGCWRMARIACTSYASNLQRHRAMCGALNLRHSAHRLTVT